MLLEYRVYMEHQEELEVKLWGLDNHRFANKL